MADMSSVGVEPIGHEPIPVFEAHLALTRAGREQAH